MTLPTIEVAPQDFSSRYRVPYPDLYDSFERNFQVNSNYEISFTMTYSDAFKEAYNLLQAKGFVGYQYRWYSIQQIELGQDEQGNSTKKVTATNYLIDMLKNIRIDPVQPLESNPDVSGGGGGGDDGGSNDPQPGTVVKKTDELQVYTLDSCLHKFMDNNDQGIAFKLHGNFPSVNVDCTGSLFEWLNSNLNLFGAYLALGENHLKQIDIYDLPSYTINTGRQFRYLNNMTSADIQTDVTEMVNDCDVFGGKMEKDTTFANGVGGGSGGDLDSVEGFCKSSINADFGVNKEVMLQNFAARSDRVKAWGVDVNKLYDTIKGQGVSPDWFFAYELQEQGSGWGWLNHTSKHGDAYQDAAFVCNWIKQTANSDSFVAATESGKGDQSLAAKWNTEFPKGTIGRVYLQGTAAAAWELEGIAGGYYGKPLSGCVTIIKSWGGHTNQGAVTSANADGGWGWPFPSTGEGSFMGAQLFGKNPGGEFRPNGFHDGLDFGSIDHPGTEVHAIHGGKVTVGPAWGSGGIGWYVVITDSTGLSVEYQEAFSNATLIHVHVGDNVHTGDVIGIRDGDHVHIGITRHGFPEAFSHAFSDDGTWLNPLDMIKNGASPGSSSGGDSSGTTTTSASYYNLHYHFEDQDSIKKYGRHRGPQVVVDSIYDMDALKNYVNSSVPHEPPTTLTISGVTEQVGLGQQMRLIVPEQGINFDVLLLGIQGNDPDIRPGAEQSLTFNNTGLTMKNVNNAIYKAIRGVKAGPQSFMLGGVAVSRPEDHFGNSDSNSGQLQGHQKIFTEADLEAIKKFTDS